MREGEIERTHYFPLKYQFQLLFLDINFLNVKVTFIHLILTNVCTRNTKLSTPSLSQVYPVCSLKHNKATHDMSGSRRILKKSKAEQGVESDEEVILYRRVRKGLF